MKTVSMKVEDRKASELSTAGDPMQQQFPWGLRLSLGLEQIQKLGLQADMPEVGDQLSFTGVGTVVSVSASATADGSSMSIEVQITDLGMEEVEDNDDAAEPQSPASILYGRS